MNINAISTETVFELLMTKLIAEGNLKLARDICGAATISQNQCNNSAWHDLSSHWINQIDKIRQKES